VAGYFAGVLAAAAVASAGLTATTGLRSSDALPHILLADGVAAAGKCSVKVDRSGTPGAATVLRDKLADGSCVCVVKTGSASANGAAEDAVASLLRDRECPNAPEVGSEAAEAAGQGAEAAGGAGFGPAGAVLPVVLGAVGAGGLAAGLGSASNG